MPGITANGRFYLERGNSQPLFGKLLPKPDSAGNRSDFVENSAANREADGVVLKRICHRSESLEGSAPVGRAARHTPLGGGSIEGGKAFPYGETEMTSQIAIIRNRRNKGKGINYSQRFI